MKMSSELLVGPILGSSLNHRKHWWALIRAIGFEPLEVAIPEAGAIVPGNATAKWERSMPEAQPVRRASIK
jgi:hypothetical protein